MIKQTEGVSLTGHRILRCKSCKQEFYVASNTSYAKKVCFCPYCGDSADGKAKPRCTPRRRYQIEEIEEEDI